MGRCIKDRLPLILLCLWAPIAIGSIAYLMSFHLAPAAETAPPERIATRFAPDQGAARVHFLDADCLCSRIVARSLIARRADREMPETVVWAGHDAELERSLRRAGFRLSRKSRSELEDAFGVTGVPQLVILSDGVATYVGGYARRLVTTEDDVRDINLTAALEAGDQVEPYPLFGCATGAAQRANQDPLRWKYDAAVSSR